MYRYIDSVEGCRGSSKLLPTMNFNSCGLLLAFIRDTNTAQSAIGFFNWLERCQEAVVDRHKKSRLQKTENGMIVFLWFMITLCSPNARV